jgi:hypothetical protein
LRIVCHADSGSLNPKSQPLRGFSSLIDWLFKINQPSEFALPRESLDLAGLVLENAHYCLR